MTDIKTVVAFEGSYGTLLFGYFQDGLRDMLKRRNSHVLLHFRMNASQVEVQNHLLGV